MNRFVSDDTWRALNPHAGRLSRRTTKRIWAAIFTAAGLVIAGATIGQTGLVYPQLATDPDNFEARFDTTDRSFNRTIVIVNRSWTTVTLNSVHGGRPGLQISDAAGFPATLRPGASTTVTIRYAVTDCSDYGTSWGPIPIKVERAWGTLTVNVPVHSYDEILTIAENACGRE